MTEQDLRNFLYEYGKDFDNTKNKEDIFAEIQGILTGEAPFIASSGSEYSFSENKLNNEQQNMIIIAIYQTLTNEKDKEKFAEAIEENSKRNSNVYYKAVEHINKLRPSKSTENNTQTSDVQEEQENENTNTQISDDADYQNINEQDLEQKTTTENIDFTKDGPKIAEYKRVTLEKEEELERLKQELKEKRKQYLGINDDKQEDKDLYDIEQLVVLEKVKTQLSSIKDDIYNNVEVTATKIAELSNEVEKIEKPEIKDKVNKALSELNDVYIQRRKPINNDNLDVCVDYLESALIEINKYKDIIERNKKAQDLRDKWKSDKPYETLKDRNDSYSNEVDLLIKYIERVQKDGYGTYINVQTLSGWNVVSTIETIRNEIKNKIGEEGLNQYDMTIRNEPDSQVEHLPYATNQNNSSVTVPKINIIDIVKETTEKNISEKKKNDAEDAELKELEEKIAALEAEIPERKRIEELYADCLNDVKNLYQDVQNGLDVNSDEFANKVHAIDQKMTSGNMPRELRDEILDYIKKIIKSKDKDKKPVEKVRKNPERTARTWIMGVTGLVGGALVGFYAAAGVAIAFGLGMSIGNAIVGRQRVKLRNDRLSGKQAVQEIIEPDDNLKEKIRKTIKNKWNDEAFLRDLNWGFTGAIIGNAIGGVAKNFNKPADNIIHDEEVIDVKDVKDIKIGEQVDPSVDLSRGYRTANNAFNQTNGTSLNPDYVNATNTYNRISAVDPNGVTHNITTPGTSVKDLIDQGYQIKSIGVANNGIDTAWLNPEQAAEEVMNVIRSR